MGFVQGSHGSRSAGGNVGVAVRGEGKGRREREEMRERELGETGEKMEEVKDKERR